MIIIILTLILYASGVTADNCKNYANKAEYNVFKIKTECGTRRCISLASQARIKTYSDDLKKCNTNMKNLKCKQKNISPPAIPRICTKCDDLETQADVIIGQVKSAIYRKKCVTRGDLAEIQIYHKSFETCKIEFKGLRCGQKIGKFPSVPRVCKHVPTSTMSPTSSPTEPPTQSPSQSPTLPPTESPTSSPDAPVSPTSTPPPIPITTKVPTLVPTGTPTLVPTPPPNQNQPQFLSSPPLSPPPDQNQPQLLPPPVPIQLPPPPPSTPILASSLPTSYAVGLQPGDLTANDFNKDGKMDIAVANSGNNSIGILIGYGDGTFADQVEYPIGAPPLGIIAAHFDNNGILDLATANLDGTISILLGEANGAFGTFKIYPTNTSRSESITAADLNNDGSVDLAVVNTNDGTASAFMGNGDGTFVALSTFIVGNQPQSITAADFNSDGKYDLAVAVTDDRNVNVFFGNGDGTFATAINYNIGMFVGAVITADFDNNGILDIAAGNYLDNTISILTGEANGTFVVTANYTTGATPDYITEADLNGDNKTDLAAANNGDNTVSIYFGNGDGTFSASAIYPTGNQPQGITAADFNGDGKIDLATANNGDNTVSILLGSFESLPTYVPSPPPPLPIETLNFTVCPLSDTVNLSSDKIVNSSAEVQLQAIFPDVCSAVGSVPNVFVGHPITASFRTTIDTTNNTASLLGLQFEIGPYLISIDVDATVFTVTYHNQSFVVATIEDLQQFMQKPSRRLHSDGYMTNSRKLTQLRKLTEVFPLDLCKIENYLCSISSQTQLICSFMAAYKNAALADCTTAIDALVETAQIEALPIVIAPCAIAAGVLAACQVPSLACKARNILPGCVSSACGQVRAAGSTCETFCNSLTEMQCCPGCPKDSALGELGCKICLSLNTDVCKLSCVSFPLSG